MGIGGTFGSVASKFYTRLNAQAAGNVVSGAWKRGGMTYSALNGFGAGKAMSSGMAAKEFGTSMYKGMKKWAWTSPRSGLTRGIRTGTLGAGLYLGKNLVDPRDNFGPF